MSENILYFISYGDTLQAWIALVVIRSGFSAVMHCIATAAFGGFLGIAKFSLSKQKIILPFAGLFIGMFMHFLWNFSVSFESTYFFGFLFMLAILILFGFVFTYSIKKEKKIIYEELWGESVNGLIPKSYLKILSSFLRNKKGWIEENIRKDYIKAATKLAFRKFQARNSEGEKQLYYIEEVQKYREIILGLTGPVEFADVH